MAAAGERVLIVGLGNPGRTYARNRHNVGFMAVERLAARHGVAFGTTRSKALVGDGRILDRSVILAKPQTYMNASGDAVGPLANYFKLAPENVLVVYDELDLPFGTIRLREQGGAGGHNGMKSILNHLGQGFPRVRLGIGRPPGRMAPAAWVLRDFGADEQPVLDDLLDEAVRAIETWLTDGIQLAMSRHNGTVVREG
ncbi:MAG: aminoacyl-tRNA hydrolase [Anaerolineales bacterium]|nr:aminoacyl-tRNA hydrolase [Anaerolineales bacterium]